MNKSIIFLLVSLFSNSFASNLGKDKTDPSDAMIMSMSSMMYMNFGLGIGTASKWTQSSLAIDAMNMGFYFKKNYGAEVGMGALANGIYRDNSSRISNFHLAAKGRLPLGDLFFVYGKLGLGVSLGQGHAAIKAPNPMMPTMMDMIMTTTAGPYYGVGLQLHLSKHFALYAEDSGIVVIPGGGKTLGSVNQGTLGLEFFM